MSNFHNHLSNETSPYLLQHVNNPVDWYPWNSEALAQAKSANKPILLSIGYAACHWCHVMAYESFEDEETALLMNRWFINIKVDREERPDLDKIYQTAHQLLTQRSGGWPLTLFLNPHNLMPFYTGTYFPKEPRYGLPAFKQILQGVANFYQGNQAAVITQNQQLQAMLQQLTQTVASFAGLTPYTLQIARDELIRQFDRQQGGFGLAPKFPQPNYLNFLLHYMADNKRADKQVLMIIETSLTKMAQGGIYDQLGGGFYRYSVDERWEIPHFEKMLYDNAQLLGLYATAYAFMQQPLYAQIVRETAAWILKDMQASEGGYYATRDADSEGEEGKYYYWSREELKQLLTFDEYKIALLYWGINQAANFENRWHLHINQTLPIVAQQLNLSQEAVQARLKLVKQKMLQARNNRLPPLRDEKILTAWNGLMIKGMAKAGIYLHEMAYINSAQRAVDFIRQNLWQEGRLLASYKDGRAKHKAYLDDYAFLLEGLLTLLQAKWRSEDLLFAIELAEGLLTYYQDEQQGGFFFTASDHEALIQRPKPFFDEAIPSGNGIAALALARLGYFIGNASYITAAENTLKAASYYLQQAPHGCASMLQVLQDYLNPPIIIILRGRTESLQEWQHVVLQDYHPERLCFAIPDDVDDLPTQLAQKTNLAQVTAYICQERQCLAPITEWAVFRQALKNTELA